MLCDAHRKDNVMCTTDKQRNAPSTTTTAVSSFDVNVDNEEVEDEKRRQTNDDEVVRNSCLG